MKTLFEEIGVPARAGSAPQIEAAELVLSHAGEQAWKIALTLYDHGDLTREQICRLTGIPNSSACARLREMEHPDPERHAFLAREPVVEKAKYRLPARSTVRVSVYRLNRLGRRLVEERTPT